MGSKNPRFFFAMVVLCCAAVHAGCALPPAPAGPNALNQPINLPVVNGRLVTVRVFAVNGAELPGGSVEDAVAWLDRYVAGDVRLLATRPLELAANDDGVVTRRQLYEHRDTLADNRPCDITVYVVPRFSDFSHRGFADMVGGPTGHLVALHQTVMEARRSILSSQVMHELVLKHELGHVLRVPADASHTSGDSASGGPGGHCTHPECLLYWGVDTRSVLTGLMRLGPPKDLCRVCRAEVAAAQAGAALIDPDTPFDPHALPDGIGALNPDNPAAFALQATLYRQADDLDAAIAAAGRAIALDPDKAWRYAFRAQFTVLAGRLDEAEADYARSLDLDGDYWPSLNNLADLILGRAETSSPEPDPSADPVSQRIEHAIALARRACEVTDWERPVAVKTLVRGLRMAGRSDEAAQVEQGI